MRQRSIIVTSTAILVGVGSWFCYQAPPSRFADHQTRESLTQRIDAPEILRAAGPMVISPARQTVSEVPDQSWEQLQPGDSFAWKLTDDYSISGIVDSVQHNEQSFSFGVSLAEHAGRMSYQRNNTRQTILVFFNGSQVVHRIQSDSEGWRLTESTVGSTLCADSDAVYPYATALDQATESKSSTALLLPQRSNSGAGFQSRPGAPTVIYCDFDGETVNEPAWFSSTIHAAPSGLSAGQIALIMEIVAEDFRPFDVNVTNVRSVYDSTPSNKRVMCISTPTSYFAPSSTGVAIIDSFVDDLVCWNFGIEDALLAGDTISHEVGHTLNLEHDGFGGFDYHRGHSAAGGETWGPIMGAAVNGSIAQWSKGEYFLANQHQDDLQLITSNGLSFRNDDYGNDIATAEPVVLGREPVAIEGVIERNTDIDVFALSFTDLGSIQIEGATNPVVTNLDLRMRIYDSANTLLLDYTSEQTKDAAAQFNLQPGQYTVWIEGDSSGTPYASSSTGWTKYGSLGAYTLRLLPDFPTRAEALDNAVSITDTGEAWLAQTAVSHDGDDALQSGYIHNFGQSIFKISKQSTRVSFWVKVSSEVGFDTLEFRIDGALKATWDGEQDWVQYNNNGLSDQEHQFEWRYSKDEAFTSGQDAAWIDQLEFSTTSGYQAWAETHAASPDGTGDSNNNGTADLLDYGISPHPPANVDAGNAIIIPDSTELCFYRDTQNSDLITRIQVSDSLEDWETVAISYRGNAFSTKTGSTVVETPVDGQTSKVSLILDTGSDSKKFARIMISRN